MSKKSAAVSASMVSALALSLVACGSEQAAPPPTSALPESVHCTKDDGQGNQIVVDDSVCQPRQDGTSEGHWYYGGSGSSFIGGVLVGGLLGGAPAGGRSYTPPPATPDANNGSVSRGGAGGTAGSSGDSAGSSNSGSSGKSSGS